MVVTLENDLEAKATEHDKQCRASFAGVKKSLSDLNEKLDKAESGVTPGEDVMSAKRQVGDMHRTVGQEIDATEKKLNSQATYEDSPKVGTLAKGLLKSEEQRRRSLSKVQENLGILAAWLENAEESWTPWDSIREAQQQLENAMKVAEIGAGPDQRSLVSA